MMDKSRLFKWPMHKLVNKSNKLNQIYLIKKTIFLVEKKERKRISIHLYRESKAIIINLSL